MRRSPPLALALLCACATATPPIDPPASAPLAAYPVLEVEEPARLRFAWRAGDSAAVELRRHLEERQGARRSAHSYAASWILDVASHPEGLSIGLSDLELRPSNPPPRRVPLYELASREGIRLIVSAAGTPVRTDGLDKVERRLESANEKKLIDAPPELRRAKAEFVGTEEMAIFDWHVGFWADAELHLGDEYTLDGDDGRVRFRAVRRLPCTDGEKPARCIELHALEDRAEEAVSENIQPLAAAFQSIVPDARFEILERILEIRLVAEETTLRPWRSERTTKVRMAVYSGDERLDDLEVSSAEERTYSWKRRKAW